MQLQGAQVTVFCGSSPGYDPVYLATARALGTALADAGATVVYGGAHVGLMGAVADAALAAGGAVVGVIPEGLARRDVTHHGLTELHVTPTMHARKALMSARADAYVALPGGYGTWEELLEVATWRQLGLHGRSIVLVDVGGYYAPLKALVAQGISAGFMAPALGDFLTFVPDAAHAVEALRAYTPPAHVVGKFGG